VSLHLPLQLIHVALQELLLLFLNVQVLLPLYGLDSLELKRVKVDFSIRLGGGQRGALDVAGDEILMPTPALLEGVGISVLDGLLELRDEGGLSVKRHSLVINNLLHREALILLEEKVDFPVSGL
jgi:hypothetical protein